MITNLKEVKELDGNIYVSMEYCNNEIEIRDKEIERLNKELQDTKEHLGEYLYEQEEENKKLNDEIYQLSGEKSFNEYQSQNEIERLNKRNKEIYEGFMATTKELTEYAEENERLNNIINEINSIVEYWGYDKEHNDISSFRMAMKNIKDILDRK